MVSKDPRLIERGKRLKPSYHTQYVVSHESLWYPDVIPSTAGPLSPLRMVSPPKSHAKKPALSPRGRSKVSLQASICPVDWALTMGQLKNFIRDCTFTVTYGDIKQRRGHVTFYDLNEKYVKPKTRNSGRCYALHLNADTPITTQVMISHAWGNDVDEFQDAIARSHKLITNSTPVWICLLSLYQTGDDDGDIGPSIKDQLERLPFQQVARYLRRQPPQQHPNMVVVHTTLEDVYSRLWCIYEVDEATTLKITVKPLGSLRYAEKYIQKLGCYGRFNVRDIAIRAEAARCTNPEDEAMIRKYLMDKGSTFESLNRMVLGFRRHMLEGLMPYFGLRVVSPPLPSLQLSGKPRPVEGRWTQVGEDGSEVMVIRGDTLRIDRDPEPHKVSHLHGDRIRVMFGNAMRQARFQVRADPRNMHIRRHHIVWEDGTIWVRAQEPSEDEIVIPSELVIEFKTVAGVRKSGSCESDDDPPHHSSWQVM